VTLRLPEGFERSGLWSLTNRVLASRGFTSIEQSSGPDGKVGVTSIVKLADAAGLAPIQKGSAEPASRRLHDADPAHQESVRQGHPRVREDGFVQAGRSITELGTRRFGVDFGFGARIEQAARIIETLDVPGQQPVIQKLPTRFVSASQLATMVTAAATARDAMASLPRKGKLIASPDAMRSSCVCPPEELEFWIGLISRFDERQTVVRKTYVPTHFQRRRGGETH